MAKFSPLSRAMRYVQDDMELPAGLGAPTRLRCEDTENPLGLEIIRPRLSWEVNDPRRGAIQAAYQILVADSEAALECGSGTLWDSGIVASNESLHRVYEGAPLESGRRYCWKVRTWDKHGVSSPWSDCAWWEMGLLDSADWQGAWIAAPEGAAPEPVPVGAFLWLPEELEPRIGYYGHAFFRHTVVLDDPSPVQEAVVQAAADAIFVLHVNGRLVGFGYGRRWTQFDLKPFLRPGANSIHVDARRHVAGGRGGFCLGARIRLANGVVREVLTGRDWEVSVATPKGDRASKMASSGQLLADDAAWTTPVVADSGYEALWNEVPVRNGDRQPAPYLRREFEVTRKIQRARAYVCGLGYHELYVNQRKVDDRVLEPGQTDYEQQALYSTYDITELLNKGRNAVGLILGDGWFNQNAIWGGLEYGRPCALAQLALAYENGETALVVTDSEWTAGHGPVRANNIYWGENYDARLEDPRWCAPGFDATGWEPAVITPAPTKRLISQLMPPIRRGQELRPLGVTEPQPGVHVFDLGQNFAGWVRLRVDAPVGTTITLRFSEMLGPDGMLDPFTTGTYHTHVTQTDTYVCRGGGETWEPRFTYHGFRYVEVTGLPFKPDLDLLQGVAVHTALDTAGTFECSNSLINQVHEAALWTEISNLHSIPTDCPARERCGWLGDAHVSAEMTLYNFLSASFWRKYLCDIETSSVDGLPTMVAPGKRTCGMATGDWGTAIVQLPWFLYLYQGDRRVLERWYPAWPRWIEHLRAQAGEDLIMEGEGLGLGDWCPPGTNKKMDTPPALTSTIYFHLDVSIAGRVAGLLDRGEDARKYEDLAAAIRDAFIERFYDRQRRSFGSQTADAMALSLNLAPEGEEQAVADSLARSIIETHGGHSTVGIMGHRFIYEALADHGHADVAHALLTQTTWPSMGFLFGIGATTLWEVFGEDDSVAPEPEYSLNHPMQGGFDAWFYSGVAGIRPDAALPAFKHILMKPMLTDQLDWAKAQFRSPYGLIVSEWERKDGVFHWTVRIPANATAMVSIPTRNRVVTEAGIPVESAEGIEIAERSGLFLTCRVNAGTYHFATAMG